jgi:small-conductance mechanosensitive channel
MKPADMDTVFAELMERLDQIEDVTDADRIAKTAEELRRVGYSPMLLVAPENFLEASLDTIRAEVKRIRTMPQAELPTEADAADDVRVQAATLLVSHYEQLTLLRLPDPKAWDDLIELYGED